MSSQNRVLTINGKVFLTKIKTLSFQVAGTQFPQQFGVGNVGQFILDTFTNQNIRINFGDGNIKNYPAVTTGSLKRVIFKVDNTLGYPPHVYTDGNSSNRIITIEFEDLTDLKAIFIQYCNVSGVFPQEIGEAKNLENMFLRTLNLSTFPKSITFLTQIKDWSTRDAITGVLPQISDGLFTNPLASLLISNTYNLSDIIASNFFKINQLKNTLESLQIDQNNVMSLPNEISDCQLLKIFRADFNNFTSLPTQLESLVNLETLTIGNLSFTLSGSTSMLNLNNLNKLKYLTFRINNINLTNIPTKWSGLYSLIDVGGGSSTFLNFINSNARFNEFIDVFYTLCTTNGSIVNNGAAAPYPNRFRNIAWGSSTLVFTGTKTAPTGYVQGVSNGIPANQGQKVFVLQNQYNHTITHG